MVEKGRAAAVGRRRLVAMAVTAVPLARRVGAVATCIIVIGLSLGLFAILTGRVLGPSDRGVLVLFMTLSSALMLVSALGCNTGARVRLVATDDPLLLPDYLGLVVVLGACAAFVSTAVGLPVLVATSAWTTSSVAPLFVVYTVLNLAGMMLRDGLVALGNSGQGWAGDAIAAVLILALSTALWLGSALTLTSALLAVTVAQIGELAYLGWRYRRHGILTRPRFERPAMARHIRFSTRALVSDFGQAMVLRFDRLLLGLLATTAQVGVYSVAATLTEAIWVIPTSVAQVVFHRVAAGLTTPRRLIRIRLMSLAVCVVSAFVLGALAPVLIRWLFGAEYLGAVTPMRILLVAAVAIGAYQVDVACVTAAGRLTWASRLTAIGFALVVLLDLALIPPFGLVGAAVASLGAYATMAVLAAWQVSRSSLPTGRTALAAGS